jgi:glycosyltransferase 2 family protein
LLLALVTLSAVRLKLLAAATNLNVRLRTATEATFAGDTLNLVLPANMGDFARATMLRTPDGSVIPAVNLSIYEKLIDVFAVFVWGAIATVALHPALNLSTVGVVTVAGILLLFLLWSGPARILLHLKRQIALKSLGLVETLLEGWIGMIEGLWKQPKLIVTILFLSLTIWAGHFAQIGVMTWALGVEGPWVKLAAILPLVILAGLAPFTLAGVGTRDAAIVILLGPAIGFDKAAALGVLFWLRYLVPGLAGLVLIFPYWASLRNPS